MPFPFKNSSSGIDFTK